uniref:Uncharacterized protein n=1 Tax=Cacopsylla melanoneura TaxID=428564 RepID=A0A8D9AKQ2_9HEMI
MGRSSPHNGGLTSRAACSIWCGAACASLRGARFNQFRRRCREGSPLPVTPVVTSYAIAAEQVNAALPLHVQYSARVIHDNAIEGHESSRLSECGRGQTRSTLGHIGPTASHSSRQAKGL